MLMKSEDLTDEQLFRGIARNTNAMTALIHQQLELAPAVNTLSANIRQAKWIYNPNPAMTFGGMGSNKLVGPNIEYIANNDSHPGAQFNPVFRDLVKTEVEKLSAETERPAENIIEAERQCDSCAALY